jgi:hypothetical protein
MLACVCLVGRSRDGDYASADVDVYGSEMSLRPVTNGRTRTCTKARLSHWKGFFFHKEWHGEAACIYLCYDGINALRWIKEKDVYG